MVAAGCVDDGVDVGGDAGVVVTIGFAVVVFADIVVAAGVVAVLLIVTGLSLALSCLWVAVRQKNVSKGVC